MRTFSCVLIIIAYNQIVSGVPLRSGTSKIRYGGPAVRGQFPYQAALFLDSTDFCGGSLISERWVLTAAHCLSGVRSVTVHLGAQVLDAEEDGRLVLPAESLLQHESFKPQDIIADIALVGLPSGVTFSEYIQTVKLPTLSQSSNTWVKELGYISGWGKTNETDVYISQELHYAEVEVIANQQCTYSYGFTIVDSLLCTYAWASTASTCFGDSGSPLVLIGDAYNNTLVGIVSFGYDEGCTTGPSAFTRVTSYLDWISANTGIVML